MRFLDFMKAQKIERRARLSAAAKQKQMRWEDEMMRVESSTVLDGVHFPNMPGEVRERLDAIGIDPENSVKAFLLDVKKGPLGGALVKGFMAQIERERDAEQRAA